MRPGAQVCRAPQTPSSSRLGWASASAARRGPRAGGGGRSTRLLASGSSPNPTLSAVARAWHPAVSAELLACTLQPSPETVNQVDPDVASGKAAEFARLDLVEAYFYEEEGGRRYGGLMSRRRAMKPSGETKSGRVEEVKVVPTPTPLAGSDGLPESSNRG